MAKYLGSKATTPSVGWGGYQVRCIRAGDFLFLDAKACQDVSALVPVSLPSAMIPAIGAENEPPKLFAFPGPWFSDDYITADGQDHLFSSQWTYSHISSRTGIRLDGPPPAWARADGGEGCNHPSNMVGYGVCPCAVSWTGDAGVIIPQDGQNQTGFIITHTIAHADLWRLGQLRPGDVLGFEKISWAQAIALEKKMTNFLASVAQYVNMSNSKPTVPLLLLDWNLDSLSEVDDDGDGVLFRRPDTPQAASLCIGQEGDRAILCVFGPSTYEIKIRARIQQIANAIRDNPPRGLRTDVIAENCSILVGFDKSLVSRTDAVASFLAIEKDKLSYGNLTNTISSRVIHLPALFDPPACHDAVAKYMLLQRDRAAYLPDNVDFIRRSNGLATREAVRDAYFGVEHLVNAVGVVSGLPLYGPIDPRHQLVVPKYNPARTWTRAGSLGSGGTTSSIYPTDGPGGYMLWGQTLPGCFWDTYGRRKHAKPGVPWLFEPFDRIVFHEVSTDEFDDILRKWASGMYEIRIEPGDFDLAAYDRLVANTADEVASMRKLQEQCTKVELEKDNQIHAEWVAAEKVQATEKDAADAGASSHASDPKHVLVASQMIASVWKVSVAIGDIVQSGAVLVILEAMKMEIAMRTPGAAADRFKVEAILKAPGDRVQAGDGLLLLSAA